MLAQLEVTTMAVQKLADVTADQLLETKDAALKRHSKTGKSSHSSPLERRTSKTVKPVSQDSRVGRSSRSPCLESQTSKSGKAASEESKASRSSSHSPTLHRQTSKTSRTAVSSESRGLGKFRMLNKEMDPVSGLHRFGPIASCSSDGREKQTIVSDLDGTLLRGRSSFPYFMLIAFEVGGYVRAVLLLLTAPLIWILYNLVSESAGIKLMIFVSFAGLKERSIKTAARAVLPRFYAEDVHPETLRVFSSFGTRFVLTANPRIMTDVFAKEYLFADEVIGTEIEVTKGGRATGFVTGPGVLVGEKKSNALSLKLGDLVADVGVGDRDSDSDFISMCKEGYMVPQTSVPAVSKNNLPTPLIFHDGRFVRRPTPLISFITLLYMPFGFLLALVRMSFGILLPTRFALHALRLLGVNIVIKGAPPLPASDKDSHRGVLFVCSHRTLLDPVMLSFALGRQVTAVTYSISRCSEMLSPIKTVPLSRDREVDAEMIRKLLEVGDLAMCPEGTTCREPFLLRYSSLFAELTDQIVPVAMANRMRMFHGTSATGWKGMDPFYFFMDPSPTYEVTFLHQLPEQLTCAGGKSSYEVANHIQRLVAATLGFQCTSFTRRDKYRILAGNDGVVPARLLSMVSF